MESFKLPIIPKDYYVELSEANDALDNMIDELLKNAETFFVDADKHNLCWDDSKEDHIKKTELRDVAYQSRKSFEQNWINVSEQVKKYLRGAE